jgi:hypothetical protein
MEEVPKKLSVGPSLEKNKWTQGFLLTQSLLFTFEQSFSSSMHFVRKNVRSPSARGKGTSIYSVLS